MLVRSLSSQKKSTDFFWLDDVLSSGLAYEYYKDDIVPATFIIATKSDRRYYRIYGATDAVKLSACF